MDALATLLAWVDLVTTTTLAGGFLFAILVVQPSGRGRRTLGLAIAGLGGVLVAELATNAWRMHRISGIGGAELVRDVMAMRWTSLWIARIFVLAAFGILWLRARDIRPTAAALVIAWLGLRSFQGHAGAHEIDAALTDWVHLVAASAWFGGLVQLASLGTPSPDALRRMRRLATAAMLVLVASGIYSALFHVRSVQALTGSAYGRTLSAKVLLAVAILVLGAVNHFRLVPRAIAGEPGASLDRAVRAELAFGAAVLGASALLGTLPMPHF
jgi:putative copper export protein